MGPSTVNISWICERWIMRLTETIHWSPCLFKVYVVPCALRGHTRQTLSWSSYLQVILPTSDISVGPRCRNSLLDLASNSYRWVVLDHQQLGLGKKSHGWFLQNNLAVGYCDRISPFGSYLVLYNVRAGSCLWILLLTLAE